MRLFIFYLDLSFFLISIFSMSLKTYKMHKGVLFMFKKLSCFFLAFLLFQTSVGAEETRNKIMLIYETYDGDISRVYYNEMTNQEQFITIDVPDSLHKEILQAKDPLLEAKKRLVEIYVAHGLDNRLKELQNEYHPNYSGVILTVQKELVKDFKHDKDVLHDFKQEVKIDKVNYDLDGFDLTDYEDREFVVEELHVSIFQQPIFYVIVSSIFAGFCLLFYFVLRKRR